MAMQWTNVGGYMANPTLSDEFRTALQPINRFRQFCDVEAALGKNRGETFQWNVYGDTVDEGGTIAENAEMPTTSFPISQGEVTIDEWGIAVPYSGRLETLSEHDIRKIVFQTLRNNANKALDKGAYAQFNSTLLTYVGTDSAGGYTFNDDGTTGAAVNNSPLNTTHVKQIADMMQERNIPVFDGENYVSIARPSALRPFKDDLEPLHMYTSQGWTRVMNGENGRYEGIRFTTQTNVADEGWSNGLSDAGYFFGADTVTEAVAVPEELRAKIGDDYGRGKGIAWYALLAFAITHADATSAETKAQARIIKWASTS